VDDAPPYVALATPVGIMLRFIAERVQRRTRRAFGRIVPDPNEILGNRGIDFATEILGWRIVRTTAIC
jgi:hypothetical protein